MAFKVAARTILELGSELISSDAIALYELIKNAIDAKSTTGVEIGFVITLSHTKYSDLLNEFEDDDGFVVDLWRERIIEALEGDAVQKHVITVTEVVQKAKSRGAIKSAIETAYADLSYIEIRDSGSGMTLKELREGFLTIGTPKRHKEILAALEAGNENSAPVLGEKGVGRLSAMRLGSVLSVETTTEGEHYYNNLTINWDDFAEDIDAMIEDIDVDAELGERKEDADERGTSLQIYRLSTSWSRERLSQLAMQQLARITDPFSTKKRRFGIYLSYNDKRIDFTRAIRKIVIDQAHAVVSGVYHVDNTGEPELALTVSAPFFNHGGETDRYRAPDLLNIASQRLGDIPAKALSTVGPFEFKLYWFNRQRLRKPDGFETLKEFRELIRRWSGIMLYRDGYQVLPYGDENTDWLELDRQALASGGYKLNKSQFVGHVVISRLGNPELIDQTNREGLRDCDEKSALLGILRFSIKNRLKPFLDECERSEKSSIGKEYDSKRASREVNELAKRARTTIKQVTPKASEDRILLKQVFEMFGELEIRYQAAEQRLEDVEGEHERLVDLAGIGLIIESLAHELARTIEHSADLLKKQRIKGLSPELTQFFNTLKAIIQSIDKRLKIIDPLSVSARQRRRDLDLRRIVQAVIDSHVEQFTRHAINVKILPVNAKPIPVFGVEGRLIQILENLISNSVHWLDVQRQLKETEPREITREITIVLSNQPTGFEFSDSGPGIPAERREKVFTPFYSTKPERKRQGLGLYIARECAQFHGGSLYLDENLKNSRGNLATFVVEIPDTRNKIEK